MAHVLDSAGARMLPQRMASVCVVTALLAAQPDGALRHVVGAVAETVSPGNDHGLKSIAVSCI